MRECGTRISPLVALIVVLACFGSVLAQGGRSTISGFVFDPEQRPVSQVMVELRNDYNSVLARIRTDGSGRYYFRGLAHGRYSVKALPFGTGFSEATVDAEITGTGMRGQPMADNVQKDIYLKLRKGADSTPFKNAVIFVQDVPREAEVLYKDAVSDLDSDRAQTGVQSLERAVEIFPTYFVALQRLGLVRLGEQKFEDAAALFTRALAINGRSFDCWYGLAYAQYSLRKFKESAASANEALVIKPDSTETNLLLGMNHRILKDFENAEKALKKAEKLAEGSSPDVHWQLALLYGRDMSRYSDAAKQLERFLELSPEAPNKEDVKKLIKQFKDKAKSS